MQIAGPFLHSSGDFRAGTLVIEDGRLARVEAGLRPNADVCVRDGWIVPSFIELQTNGSYGHDLTHDPASLTPLAAALPQQGVTAFLPTVITSAWETYPQRLRVLKEAMADARGAQPLGLHLEGPYLNPTKAGAHPPHLLRAPDADEIAAWASLAPTRLLTLAPELPGAPDAVARLRQMGIVVSVGHSAATYDGALAAFRAGVTYGTHLYNAMPPLHHREPGLVAALLAAPDVVCGLIADGVHVHPAMVALAWQMKGTAGITLVTDAMAAAGMPPGRYMLGEQAVTVTETEVRIASGSLAGSVLTMERAVRNMMAFTGCTLAAAIRMATETPARVLGLQRYMGTLAAGQLANIVVLNETLDVEWTLVQGREAFRAAHPTVWR